jgi:hypothetical protein
MAWPWQALWRLLRGSKPDVVRSRELFTRQRPQLEQTFFQEAVASGKPRGLRWKACEWEAGAEFARERATGRLAALVGVTIQFEAVDASAVFFFHGGQWHTTGKALFNLNPDEVLDRFANQYEKL